MNNMSHLLITCGHIHTFISVQLSGGNGIEIVLILYLNCISIVFKLY